MTVPVDVMSVTIYDAQLAGWEQRSARSFDGPRASAVDASLNSPPSFVRGVAHIVLESTKAWSRAVHTWLGITHAQFWNEQDVEKLRSSIPVSERQDLLAELLFETASSSLS